MNDPWVTAGQWSLLLLSPALNQVLVYFLYLFSARGGVLPAWIIRIPATTIPVEYGLVYISLFWMTGWGGYRLTPLTILLTGLLFFVTLYQIASLVPKSKSPSHN